MLFRSLRYSKKVLCRHIAIVRNVENKRYILCCQHFCTIMKMKIYKGKRTRKEIHSNLSLNFIYYSVTYRKLVYLHLNHYLLRLRLFALSANSDPPSLLLPRLRASFSAFSASSSRYSSYVCHTAKPNSSSNFIFCL